MGRPALNLVGRKFGRISVVSRAGSTARAKLATWNCLCECGNEAILVGPELARGRVRSCGCISFESNATGCLTHGQSGRAMTKEYKCWVSMRYRCLNPRSVDWPNYGGRGITVCERWGKFENFLADMGLCPTPELSIDRKNNDGGYDPGNCRWATHSEQNLNRRPMRSTQRREVVI